MPLYVSQLRTRLNLDLGAVHRRIGDIGDSKTRRLNDAAVGQLPRQLDYPQRSSETCQLTKSVKAVNREAVPRTTAPPERVHLDQ